MYLYTIAYFIYSLLLNTYINYCLMYLYTLVNIILVHVTEFWTFLVVAILIFKLIPKSLLSKTALNELSKESYPQGKLSFSDVKYVNSHVSDVSFMYMCYNFVYLASKTSMMLKKISLFILLLAIFAYVSYRSVDRTYMYFLQPCTIILCSMTYLYGTNSSPIWKNVLFTYIVSQIWGPAIATFFPDAGAGWLPYEKISFGFNHWFILLSPILFERR